ncbi:6-phospho-3-hexuloisomerase [Pseudalkalibacillus sp. A8]|uniref:6-phospho-3-hexuloisomerase n=1 Tax=Pseudalkalibacillus sp. A8 TaxID=3382641 RepID=UPI0038B58368
MKEIHLQILNELQQVAEGLDDEQIKPFIEELRKADRIFVSGEGRSGLMGKAFAMRLMHAGYTVFVTGETITPSIKEGDVLVSISGSGNTKSVKMVAEQAKSTGALVLLVSTNQDSEIGRFADRNIIIKAATKHDHSRAFSTIQPMGNQFDQSVHLLLDAIVIALTKETENLNEVMKQQHANLE